LVKEELCDLVKEEYGKVVEVQRMSDKVMVMDFGEVVRVVCAYGPQSGTSIEETSLL